MKSFYAFGLSDRLSIYLSAFWLAKSYWYFHVIHVLWWYLPLNVGYWKLATLCNVNSSWDAFERFPFDYSQWEMFKVDFNETTLSQAHWKKYKLLKFPIICLTDNKLFIALNIHLQGHTKNSVTVLFFIKSCWKRNSNFGMHLHLAKFLHVIRCI